MDGNQRSNGFASTGTRWIRRSLACCLFAAASAAQAGQSYYVRTIGDDAASGLTPEEAFASVQRGIVALQAPGDSLIVGPGRYFEALDIGAEAGEAAIDGTKDDPCIIMGDRSGALTGDAPGPIVIDGADEESFGLRVHGRHYWKISGLEFRNQQKYGVAAKVSQGLEVNDCVIDGPTHFAVLGYRCRDMSLDGNTIERDRFSGHCIYVWVEAGELAVTGNRFNMQDDAYLSTPFKKGERKRRDGDLEAGAVFPYGVVAVGYGGQPVDIRFEENIGSDCYLGMFAYGIGEDSKVTIRSNTLTGCYYPMYVYGFKSPEVVIDRNVLTDSFFGPSGYGADALISRTIVHNITRPGRFSGASVNADFLDEDPQFADAAGGDFTPVAASVLETLGTDYTLAKVERMSDKAAVESPLTSLREELRTNRTEAIVDAGSDEDGGE